MTYSLKQYWNDLSVSLKSYQDPVTDSKNTDDEKNLELQKQILKEMLALGIKVEKTSVLLHPQLKLTYGEQLESLHKKWGGDEIPAIKGKKSLDFAQKVYLPYLKKFKNVIFSKAVIEGAKLMSIDLQGRQQKMANRAEKLETSIKSYLISLSNNHFFVPSYTSLSHTTEKKSLTNSI